MSSEFFVKVPAPPAVPPRPVVIEVSAAQQAPPAAPTSTEKIRAVDAAFARYADSFDRAQPQEREFGLPDIIGLYAGMLWAGEMAKDAMRPKASRQDDTLPPPHDERDPRLPS
jgi:hypothetical protein